MKIQILDITGKKVKEIETNLFEEPIREDIIYKIVEAEKLKQPYSSKYRAGMDSSASGNVTHRRHTWKSDRGRGLSRVPRKIFWRRGTQFSWQGAIIPSVRGGRRAHPPKNSVNLKKINKKEMNKALLSALTYIISVNEIKKKYSSLKNQEIKINLPLIVEDKSLGLNTKDFFKFLEKILGNLYGVAIQKKAIRAGKGTRRGRKYKRNAGVLFVIGNNNQKKIKGIEVIKSDDLLVSDLASNGARLVIFTEEAVKDLNRLTEKKVKKIKDTNKKSISSETLSDEKNSLGGKSSIVKNKLKEKK